MTVPDRFPTGSRAHLTMIGPERFPDLRPIPDNPRSAPVPDLGTGRPHGPDGPSVRRSPSPPLYSGDRGPTEPRNCVRGEHFRVLLDRHDQDCPIGEGGACGGCQACPGPHCPLCRREHSHSACPGCVGAVRLNLEQLARLARLLPAQAITGRVAYHHHHGVPGGDAVVMLSPGTGHWPAGWTHPVTAEPGDVRPPLDVLARWANLWLARTGASAGGPRWSMPLVVAYLDTHLAGIGADPIMVDLAQDVARTLHQVENVLHAGDRPEVSRVPCWECGTRLHKVWAETEAGDHWRCPACGEDYDHGRYERAKRDHLHSRDAERYVSLTDAVGVTGRPEATVRAWVAQGLVAARRGPTGRVQVWWPDVRDRDLATGRVPGRSSRRVAR